MANYLSNYSGNDLLEAIKIYLSTPISEKKPYRKIPSYPLVEGQSYQAITTQGKNFAFSLSSEEYLSTGSGITFSNGSIVLPRQSWGQNYILSKKSISVAAGQIFIATCIFTSSDGIYKSSPFAIRFMNSAGTVLQPSIGSGYNSYYNANLFGFNYPITIPTGCASIKIGICCNTNHYDIGAFDTFLQLQLEVGSTATSYVPFIPNSPTADYPATITGATQIAISNGIVTKNTSSATVSTVTACLKNLLRNTSNFQDLTYWSVGKGAGQLGTLDITSDAEKGKVLHYTKSNNVSWEYVANSFSSYFPVLFDTTKKYTIAFDIKSTMNNIFSVNFMDSNAINNVCGKTFSISSNWQRVSLTFTPVIKGNNPILYMSAPIGEYWFTNFQLEINSIATDYEPYVGTTYALPQTLYNLPNGVEDTFDASSGVLTQQMKQIVLKGTEGWLHAGTNMFAVNTLDGVNDHQHATQILVRCDRYLGVAAYETNANNTVWLSNIDGQPTFRYIYFYDNSVGDDLATFKSKLTSNNVTVHYQLATPIITQLTPISLNLDSILESGYSYSIGCPCTLAPLPNVLPINIYYGTYNNKDYMLYKLNKFGYVRVKGTDGTWGSWSAPLDDTKIYRTLIQPVSPIEGDMWLDMTTDPDYPSLKIYLNNTWNIIDFDHNPTNVLTSAKYDPNAYRTNWYDEETIKKVDEKLTTAEIDSKITGELHRQNEDIHIKISERAEFNSKLTTTDMNNTAYYAELNIRAAVDSVYKESKDDVTTNMTAGQNVINNINSHDADQSLHVTDAKRTLYNSKASDTHQHLKDGNVTLDASHVIGKLSIDRLPKAAFDVLYYVQDDAARLVLTIDKVQNGDTVCVVNPKKTFWRVVDDTKLTSDDGYILMTEAPALTTDWSTIKNKPTTISGYGITDLYTKTETDTTIMNNVITKSNHYADSTIQYKGSDRLAGLSMRGGSLLNLSPSFSKNIFNYTTVVNMSATSIYVTPTVDDQNASLKVNDCVTSSGLESFPITTPQYDPTPITIAVIPIIGDVKDYYVTAFRQVFLNAILIKKGLTTILSTAFSPSVLNYQFSSTITGKLSITPSVLVGNKSISLTYNSTHMFDMNSGSTYSVTITSGAMIKITVYGDGINNTLTYIFDFSH